MATDKTNEATKITEDELTDLLREVVRDEILKDPRPTLETLKVLHADRPLLVVALDTAIAGYSAARPAPSGDLVEAAQRFCGDNHGQILAAIDDLPIFADLMASFAEAVQSERSKIASELRKLYGDWDAETPESESVRRFIAELEGYSDIMDAGRTSDGNTRTAPTKSLLD